jgi:(R,R)-butanediol dehydrogenase / meso-butanediol dehydrogenase / diacetyl reductase
VVDQLQGVRSIRPDVVIECTGRGGLVQQGIDVLGRHGRLLIAGLHGRPSELRLRGAFFKEVNIGFSSWYEMDEFAITVEALRSCALEVPRFVTRIVGLAELPDIYERLKRDHDECKVVVDPRGLTDCTESRSS